tara:strand:- start:55 stop:345 length:291 start_codon:yes stop_codon:yes gene_type:complete
MFIIFLTYQCPLEKIDKYLDSHVAYLKQEYDNGNFIASGRKNPRTGGIILSNVKTEDDLKSILKKDPFYQKGLAKYDITEFIPTMVAEGFELLKEI